MQPLRVVVRFNDETALPYYQPIEKQNSFSLENLGDTLMKTSVFTPFIIVLCALSLAACANTVRGVGKDVKDTGRAVQQTVQ